MVSVSSLELFKSSNLSCLSVIIATADPSDFCKVFITTSASWLWKESWSVSVGGSMVWMVKVIRIEVRKNKEVEFIAALLGGRSH